MKKALFLILSIFSLLPSQVSAVVETVNLTGSQPGGVPTNTSTGNLIASALQIIFILAGLAVLIFLVWGSFDWITAGGDKEKIAGARRKIVNAIIGLFLLALAAFVATLVSEIARVPVFNQGTIPTLGQPNSGSGTTPAAPTTP